MNLRTILEGKDLKGIALNMADDLNGGRLEDTIEYVIQGNQGGEQVYTHITSTLDTTKKNYGKRGSNLIAYVGGVVIGEEYDVNMNQAQSIFKKLDKATQDKFNDLIKSQLETLEKELAE